MKENCTISAGLFLSRVWLLFVALHIFSALPNPMYAENHDGDQKKHIVKTAHSPTNAVYSKLFIEYVGDATNTKLVTPPVINIPDAKFAAAIKAACPTCIDGSNNLTAAAASLTQLDVNSKNIKDLTGIAGFASLKRLYCNKNSLTSIPTLPSGLTTLDCTTNSLTSLPTLPSGLTTLDCTTNSLTSLPTLPSGLTTLDCSTNSLTSLPTLPSGLQILACTTNSLTSLPTLPSGLQLLNCLGNSLTSLPTLPISLQLIQIDYPAVSCLPNAVSGVTVFDQNSNDITTTITVCCPSPTGLSHIPDANFAAAIRTVCPTCIDACNNLTAAATSLKDLDVGATGIKDLTGIAGFTSLQTLYSGGNNLTSLPTLPSGLQSLNCSGSTLTSLPTLPSGLQTLNCNTNSLTSLPTLPSNLKFLDCSSNSLTSLPMLPSNLTSIDCSYNSLTSLPTLPLSLTSLTIDYPAVSCLPNAVSGVTIFDQNGNDKTTTITVCCPSPTGPSHIPDANFAAAIRTACPTCIDACNNLTAAAASLKTLNLNNQGIKDLTGIAGFTSLQTLRCNYNKFTSLPALPSSLTLLSCGNNQLTSLPDLPNSLTRLYCYSNSLTSLPTLPGSLSYLDCTYNSLTSLPMLPNSLTNLDCYGNKFTSLPTLPSSLSHLDCSQNSLTSLPTLPLSLTELYIDQPAVSCLPNAVSGIKVYDQHSKNITTTITVCCTAPQITSQISPTKQTICVGSAPTKLTITATTTETGELTYQWYSKDNPGADASRITDATNASYTPPTTTSGTTYYYCVVSNSCNRTVASNTDTVIVNPLPPTPTISGADSVAISLGNLPLTGSPTGGVWFTISSNIAFGSKINPTYVQGTALGTATIYYAYGLNGCSSNVSKDIKVYCAPPKILTQPSPQTICQNGSVSALAVTMDDPYFDYFNEFRSPDKIGFRTEVVPYGLTYQWYSNTSNSNTGGTLISGATNATYTPSSTTVGTTYYYCIIKSYCDGAVTTNAVKFLVNPLPTPSISGASTVNINATITLTGSPAGGTWSANNSLVSVGATSGVVTGKLSGNSIITYTYTDGNGCVGKNTQSIAVNCSAPVISIQPAPATQSVCQNATTSNISISATDPNISLGVTNPDEIVTRGVTPSGLTYQWYSNTTNSNSGGTPIANATNATFTPPSNTAGTVYYYCVVTSPCSSTTSNTVAVIVNALPSPNISGASTVNINATITLTGSPSGGTWSANNSFVSVGATSGVVTGKLSGNSIITYTYTDGNGCVGKNTKSIAVNCGAPVISTQPAPATQSVCQNASTSNISISATDPNISLGVTNPDEIVTRGVTPSGLTYQWYSNTTNSNSGGTPIANATNATFTPPSNTAGTMYYYCVITSPCSSTTSNTVAVIVNALPSPNISGASTVNINANIILTGSPSGGTWSANNSFVSVGATSGVVTGKLYGNSIVTYTYTDGNGCVGTTTKNITINCGAPVISTQPAPATQTVCLNTTTTPISLSATDPNLSGLSYQWYSNVNNSNIGGNLIAGATLASYSPSSSTAGTMYYYCVVVSSCGNANTSTTSNTAKVIVNSLPSPIITGASTVDVNNIIALSSSVSGGTWSSNSNNVSVDKNIGTVIGLSVGNAIITYTYTDGNGCVGQATKNISVGCPALTITSQPLATSPAVIISGETLPSITFTASASSTLPMTVKWQRKGAGDANFSDIGSAVNYVSNTIASYTTNKIGTSEDGAQYRAVFSTNCNTVTTINSTVSVTVYQYIGLSPYPNGLPDCLKPVFRELEKIYNTCNGANWKNKSGWLRDPNLNNWYGIKLTDDGCDVASIDLSNNLKKSAPGGREYIVYLPQSYDGTFIQINFPRMDSLNLSGNNLSGVIYNYNFPSLKVLNLRNNKLNGSIPDFQNCPLLKKLLVDTNQLSGNIPEFNLPKIDTFGISSNNFIFGDIANKSWLTRNAITYAPQNLIPLTYTNGVLSVNTGQPDAIQTFNWYRDGVLITTTNSSSFKPVLTGAYSCQIVHKTLTVPSNVNRNLILTTAPLKVTLPSTVQLSGAVLSENNQIVAGVTVDARISNSNFGARAVTNTYGTFTSDIERSANYQLRATKSSLEDKYLGVSTYDIALISKHILGIETLNSPYKMIAADVDKSNTVDVADILALRRFILNIDPQLPSSVWRFIDKSYYFKNPLNPFGEDFPEVVNIDMLSGNQTANFVAVKMGDVNQSYSPDFVKPIVRTVNTIELKVDNQNVVAGNEYTIKIKAENLNAKSLQGTLEFKNAVIKAIKPGDLNNMSDTNFGMFDGAVTTSWNGDALSEPALNLFAEITFKANTNAKLSDILALGSSKTPLVANDINGNEMNVALKFNNSQPITNDSPLTTMNVLPNPAKDRVTILFDKFDTNSSATIRLLDLLGRELMVQQTINNSTHLDISSFNAGFYMIEVELKGKRYVQKLVKE